MNTNSENKNTWNHLFAKSSGGERELIDAKHFAHVISRERKRAERNGKCLLLLIMDISDLSPGKESDQFISLLSGLHSDCIREIDACGWLCEEKQLGVVFTEIQNDMALSVKFTVEQKICHYLRAQLPELTCDKIKMEILVFPEKSDILDEGQEFNPVFYPELFQHDAPKLFANGVKRTIDVIGSIVAILLFSPFFLIISILIKLTSPGSLFFKQERLGRFGGKFNILKFRSMSVNCDDSVHRQYISDLIANKVTGKEGGKSCEKVYKLQNDVRVTPLGKFLRKSSLDEIPQFFNVLKGDMSLVGPRPPIPYEVSAYYLWHCYRSFAIKPGITGLWQVTGRSRTTFDEMVRLDIQYIRNWSIWLDIKLLLATPRAVLRSSGAY